MAACLPFENVISCERSDSQAVLTVQNYTSSDLETKAKEINCTVDIKPLPLEEISPELNNDIKTIDCMYGNENGLMYGYVFGSDIYYKHIEIIVNEVFSIAKDLNIQLFLYVNSIEVLNIISEVSRNLNLDDRFRLLRLEVRDNGIPYTIDYTLDILESSIESGWEFR